MKKHVVYNKTTKKIVYICESELPEGFRLEDSELAFFEWEGSEGFFGYQLQFIEEEPLIVEIPKDMSSRKWNEIRKERLRRLTKEVDSKEKYLIHGDVSLEEKIAIKAHRTALLNVPQDIEAKITSGEIASVMDIDIETYPWPVLE